MRILTYLQRKLISCIKKQLQTPLKINNSILIYVSPSYELAECESVPYINSGYINNISEISNLKIKLWSMIEGSILIEMTTVKTK